MVHPYSSQIHPDAARNWLSEHGERDDGVFLLSSSFSRASELIERMKTCQCHGKEDPSAAHDIICHHARDNFDQAIVIVYNKLTNFFA